MMNDRVVASTILDMLHSRYIKHINNSQYREAQALQDSMKAICDHYKILYVFPEQVPLAYNEPSKVPTCTLPSAACIPIKSIVSPVVHSLE